MNNLIITEEERKEILLLHYLNEQEVIDTSLENPGEIWKKYGQNKMVWQSLLKCLGANLGNSGLLKNGVDGKFGKKSMGELKRLIGNDSKLDAQTFMKLLFATRKTRGNFKCLAKHVPGVGKKYYEDDDLPKIEKQPEIRKDEKQKEGEYSCIAVPKEVCSKIRINGETKIGKDPKIYQCAAYVIKCLSEYENLFNKFAFGNAWGALQAMKNDGGSVKYNLFNQGFDWNKLQEEIKTLKYNSQKCIEFQKKPIVKDTNVDNQVDGGKLSKAIADSYPKSSSVNLENLKLGDVVGIYLPSSSNKGRAFCDSAKLDKNGNIIEKNVPINTHVGFIGAIKSNRPIVFHNIHGEFRAQPAIDFRTNSSPGMIVWVVSDPTVSANIEKRKKVESGFEEPSWVDKNIMNPLYDIKRNVQNL
jgi:hypothetical protein